MAKFNLLTVLDLDQKGFNSGLNNVSRTVQQFKGTISATTKGLMSFLGPIGLGAGVFETLKQGIESTDGSADKLEETIGLLEGGFQGLFRTIFSGDWDNLISNIVNTAAATRDLKRATDELGNITASNTIRTGRYRRELEAARLAAAETSDPKLKAQYIQQAIDAQKAITSIEVSEVNKKLDITEDFFKTSMGWSEDEAKFNIEQIRKIAANYEYYFGEGSVAVEGIQKRIENLKYRSVATMNGLTEAQKEELRQLTLLNGSLEIYKDLMDGLKPDQFNEYIKGIGEMEETIAGGDQALIKLTKSLTTQREEMVRNTKTAEQLALELERLKSKNEKLQPDRINPFKIKIPSFTDIGDPNKLIAPAQTFKETWYDALIRVGTLAQDVAGAFTQLGMTITQASEDGKVSFAEAMNIIVQASMSAISILSALAAAQIITKEASKGVIGLFTALAGLGMLASMWSAFVKPKKMAAGGIVYGDSLVNVGEYPSARSNPEVIAPLDKLRDLIGGGTGEVTFRIQGDTLVGVLNNHNRKSNSYR